MTALLISGNADIKVPCIVDDFTPLASAAYAGHVETVKLLLKHGAGVDPKAEMLARKCNYWEIVPLLRRAGGAKGESSRGSPEANLRGGFTR
jgi:ankyrin repeat protein